jgi:hypothetical protein
MGQHAMAVVDDEFEAHGLDELRVIDASVMPAVTSTNTNAPTIIIAEKCRDHQGCRTAKKWWRRTRRRAGRCRRLVEREDVALQPQLLVLRAQPCQLVTLCSGQHVTLLLPAALLPLGLCNPVADRLRCRLKLAGQGGRIAPSANQIDHLATKLR